MSGTSSSSPSSKTSAVCEMKVRGMYQVPEACEPATNSSVLSRADRVDRDPEGDVLRPSTQ